MLTFLQVLELPGNNNQVSGPTGLRLTGSLGSIISTFIPIIFTIAGILTFIWLIIGGFRLLISGGDPKNVAGARDNITFAIIGLAIVFAAWWLTLIVQRALGICIVQVWSPIPPLGGIGPVNPCPF